MKKGGKSKKHGKKRVTICQPARSVLTVGSLWIRCGFDVSSIRFDEVCINGIKLSKGRWMKSKKGLGKRKGSNFKTPEN